MPENGIRHTFLEGPWHYCGRCGEKTKLESELQWQRGVLLCNECWDNYPLIGQIDQAIAQYMMTVVQEPDLKPSPKLTNPTLDIDNDDIFI